MDSWNSITFVKAGQQTATYSGTDVAGLTGLVANGDQQTASSNRYINFDLGDSVYDEVVLSTTNWGFEVDNIAFADPPVRFAISSTFTGVGINISLRTIGADNAVPTLVPEPGTLMLLGSSLCGFVAARRRKPGSRRRAQYERGMPRTCWPR